MRRLIHHTFGPLADRHQRMLALALSYAPWAYRRGRHVEELRQALREKFSADVALFSSGRESLFALLKAMKFPATSEVILPAYTCVVLPNAIQAAGLTPIYADIDARTLTSAVHDIEKCITPRTKAIICQHTFGIPAPIADIRDLCNVRGITLIEDCAHILPDDEGPADVGMLGDAVLLSFGRDKAISGIAGGAMVYRNPVLRTAMRAMEDGATDLSWSTVAAFIEYPAIYAVARALYGVGIGKALLWICAKTRLLVPILTPEEKRGRQSPILHRLPNVCAALALDQLRRLKQINNHRRLLTKKYLRASALHGWPVLHGIASSLPLQKYPLFLPNAEAVRAGLKRRNMHLYDGWSICTVCPSSVDPTVAGYRSGIGPAAENACTHIIALPTHPGMREADADRLLRELQRRM